MMTEEEQMEAALAASLGQDPQASLPPSPEAVREPFSPPPQPQTPQPQQPPPASTAATVTQPEKEFKASIDPSVSSETNKVSPLFSTIIPADTPEPPQSLQTTRIQFRFPEGGRPLVRRFNKSDTIRDIFAFVKGLRGDDEEQFELVFVGRRLLAEAEASPGGSALEKSIVEAELANGSLTVELLGD
jgi:UBX domain